MNDFCRRPTLHQTSALTASGYQFDHRMFDHHGLFLLPPPRLHSQSASSTHKRPVRALRRTDSETQASDTARLVFRKDRPGQSFTASLAVRFHGSIGQILGRCAIIDAYHRGRNTFALFPMTQKIFSSISGCRTTVAASSNSRRPSKLSPHLGIQLSTTDAKFWRRRQKLRNPTLLPSRTSKSTSISKSRASPSPAIRLPHPLWESHQTSLTIAGMPL